MDIHARAHRTLKKLALFKETKTSSNFRFLQTDEEVIGVYENPDPSEHLVFTTTGIYLRPHSIEKWHGIYYADVASVKISDKKSTVLQLNKSDGDVVLLPVRGVRDDRFLDSLEVLRFLDRVLADQNERHSDSVDSKPPEI